MRETRHITEADWRRWESYPQTKKMPWHQKWAVCRQNQPLLNEWERNFLTSMREPQYWVKDLVSNKQLDLLDKIYDRLLFKHHVHYRAKHGG